MNHWSSFRSVYTEPEWVSRITDDALFVEHFGFCEYYPEQQQYLRPEYAHYKQRVIHKISSAAESGRTIFMVIPRDYLRAAMQNIEKISDTMIFLPTLTDEAVRCDGRLLGSPEYEYKVWDDLSKRLTSTEIIGEYADPGFCIPYVEFILKLRDIRVRRDDACVYMSYQDAPFNGVL